MPTPTYTPLANVTLASSTASVVMSNIPATYRDLILVFNGGANPNNQDLTYRFNGDTGSNYTSVVMSGNGSATISSTFSDTSMRLHYYAILSNDLNGTAVASVMDYSATDKHKTVIARTNKTTGGSFQGADAGAGRWANTAAITSVTFMVPTNFTVGSTFSLYGVIA
jgi:hypothetical protein